MNEQILVVDREPDVLALSSRILTRSGCDVFAAESGRQALQIACETPIDLVMTDVRMPDRDGISLYEAIRSYQPDVIGILTTAFPTLEIAIEAFRKGISGLVLKPFTVAELREAVDEGLAYRRLQRENARLKALIPLYELSRSLMTNVDLATLLEQVVEVAVQETGADRASLMLEEGGELSIVAACGLPQDVVHRVRTPIGEGIAGWVAKYGEPLLLDETVSMPAELANALQRQEISSAVCAPLKVGGRVIGVLNLAKLERPVPPFTPSDRDLISVLAGQVAMAIENARLGKQQRILIERLGSTNGELRSLTQPTIIGTNPANREDVFQTDLFDQSRNHSGLN